MVLAVLFYDVVKWFHIMAVVVAFGGAFLYPIWFRFLQGAPADQRVFFHRSQATFGKFVISPGLLLILISGAYLASDRHSWSQAWVTVPLIIVFILGGLSGMYFGPREQRLSELREGAEYEALFRQVTLVTWAALGLVLLAAFFMVTKLGS